MILSCLILAFVLMPIIELIVLFKVYQAFELGPTLAIVILTGIIGAYLARAQGMMVLRQTQQDLAEGRMPAPRLIDGVMILVAGVLLVTPGLVTDTIGFLLLVPPVRVAIRMWMRRRLEAKLRNGSVTVTTWDWGGRER